MPELPVDIKRSDSMKYEYRSRNAQMELPLLCNARSDISPSLVFFIASVWRAWYSLGRRSFSDLCAKAHLDRDCRISGRYLCASPSNDSLFNRLSAAVNPRARMLNRLVSIAKSWLRCRSRWKVQGIWMVFLRMAIKRLSRSLICKHRMVVLLFL